MTTQVTEAQIIEADLQNKIKNLNLHFEEQQQANKILQSEAYKRGDKKGRQDALKRSKSITHGFVSENFAPLFNHHDWNPKDFRHMGDPIDYLVIPGMSLVHQAGAQANVEEVVLLDIKTGNSQLNTVQRRIRDAVVNGRVRFATYNTDKGQLRCWPPSLESAQLKLPLKTNTK